MDAHKINGSDTITSTTAFLLNDKLFNNIENHQEESGRSSFGRLLDAGTGSHSLRWIAGLLRAFYHDYPHPLHVSEYTAITADEKMRQKVLNEATKWGIETRGNVIVGNWFQQQTDDDDDDGGGGDLLHGELYDTILADYLVGAMDGFSPYFQDRIFTRLLPHLAEGGHLYVIGLQPIPDSAPGDANIMCRITKVRDACILLAGHRCYREYPLDWIVRKITDSCPGLRVEAQKTFPILYSFSTMSRQIDVARSKLDHFSNMVGNNAAAEGLSQGMKAALDDLEKDTREACDRSNDARIKLGFDYVVCAKRVD